MKKVIVLFILFIGIISITGCSKEEESDALKFKKEYESLNNKTINKKKLRSVSIDKENPIIYKEAKDIVKMIDDNESFIVYFGYAESPWCRSMVEELIKVAKDYEMDIYYVDIKDIRDEKELDDEGNIVTKKEGTKDYLELLNRLDNLLEEYKIDDISMNEKRINEPTVIAIANGTPLEITNGISDNQKNPNAKITDKMKKTMYKKIECLAKCINEASAICTKNAC